jgi:hypothetical protein
MSLEFVPWPLYNRKKSAEEKSQVITEAILEIKRGSQVFGSHCQRETLLFQPSDSVVIIYVCVYIYIKLVLP